MNQVRQQFSSISANPFISHEFLSSLELSNSVCGRAGWLPQHLVVEDPDGGLRRRAVLCEIHSRGEYVFDHGWADAYERAGGSYYPKLQVAVPFTPATGRRLLVRPEPIADTARAGLADALAAIVPASELLLRACHLPAGAGMARARANGFLQRTDRQFHWHNTGYATFDDFLCRLASRKRKAIRRERRDALENGITVHWLTGSDLTEEVWDAFFAFYMETGSRKWGRPYLTREFYSLVGERWPTVSCW